jgi:hypothetical protein
LACLPELPPWNQALWANSETGPESSQHTDAKESRPREPREHAPGTSHKESPPSERPNPDRQRTLGRVLRRGPDSEQQGEPQKFARHEGPKLLPKRGPKRVPKPLLVSAAQKAHGLDPLLGLRLLQVDALWFFPAHFQEGAGPAATWSAGASWLEHATGVRMCPCGGRYGLEVL